MAKQKFSDDERAAAVVALGLAGGNVARVSRDLGIPQSTLRHWKAGEGVIPPKLVTAKRAAMDERLGEVVDLAIGIERSALAWLGEQPPEVQLKSLDTVNRAMGTAFDKRQIATGEPTARVDHTGLTDDEAIAAARKLRILDGGQPRRSA